MTFKQKIESGSIKVGIIGLGYVGLPLADSTSKRNVSTCSHPALI